MHVLNILAVQDAARDVPSGVRLPVLRSDEAQRVDPALLAFFSNRQDFNVKYIFIHIYINYIHISLNDIVFFLSYSILNRN